MRTAASENLNQSQMMARLGATFSALIHEQIDIVRRSLDEERNDESGELRPVAELSVRLVERSAEWLHVGELASLALEIREAMAQLGQLRPAARQAMIAQCRVALEAEEKVANRLRSEGFSALVEHAEQVTEAIDRLRANLSQARSEAREMIDSTTPDVGAQENLLALSFEIKSALVHQNERIGAMNELVDAAIRSSQLALGEWETIAKVVERERMAGRAVGPAEALPEGRALAIHQRMQDLASGLQNLAQEVAQLCGLQYSLERRARDLDEHLLWEFLDPLERYVDDFYAAVARNDGRPVRLAVQTGGVGFDPEVGPILLPLIRRLLHGAEPLPDTGGEADLRLTAAREGLEARMEIEGRVVLDGEALRLLEGALESLGGFSTLRVGAAGAVQLRLQFPMARTLRSFLIVEAAGQRLALPWSAVERIHASSQDLPWGSAGGGPAHPLAVLFGGAAEAQGDPTSDDTLPRAVLRCGGGAAIVSFDRIVWRENARLRPLPRRLHPIEEVLGGIVGPDNSITLVLHPAALLRRAGARHGAEAGTP
jgi:hypothetical protein